MVGITLPGTAGADETGTRAGQAGRSVRQEADAGRSVAPGVVEEAPAEGEKGTGRDPLTDDEMERVAKIALNRQLLQGSESVDGQRGPQRLGVDLAEPEADEVGDPNAPRRADVTFYDYRDDTLVTRTVDLGTGKVVRTGSRMRCPAAPERRREGRGGQAADRRPARRGPQGRLPGRHRQGAHLPGPAAAQRRRLPGRAGRPAGRARPLRRAPLRPAVPEDQERALGRREVDRDRPERPQGRPARPLTRSPRSYCHCQGVISSCA